MKYTHIAGFVVFICYSFVNVSCRHRVKQTQVNKETYTEHFVKGGNVKLHYLDWGGSGEPLVLIHGLGDSPFLFEDLANTLSQHFRVIAYSRRGHCKSETTDSSYDNSTLVADLKLLLDSLNIQKANLLGWSMGGNEITGFAIQYPERVNKLIYFEAGYDLSEQPFKTILDNVSKSAFASSADLVSLDAYRKWVHGFWFPDVEWNSTLESNLQATIVINPNGSVTSIPAYEVSKTTLQQAMTYHRSYNKVSAPALFLFTNTFFHAADNDATTAAFYDSLENEVIIPWRQHSINRIKTEMKNASIITLTKGSHASLIFLSKNEIVQSVNSFLLEKN